MASDWIPRVETKLVDLCANWLRILANGGKVISYNWDPAVCNATMQLITAFTDARDVYEADKSQLKCITKDKAKDAAVNAMRDFANRFVRFNPLVSVEDKVALGIHIKDTTMTTHGAPVSRPDTEVSTTLNRLEHKLRALHQGKAVKPPDAYGVRYSWQIGGDAPVSSKDLHHTKFSRKTSMVVTFDEADKGKTVYYATCYENSKGDMGPWSLIESAGVGWRFLGEGFWVRAFRKGVWKHQIGVSVGGFKSCLEAGNKKMAVSRDRPQRKFFMNFMKKKEKRTWQTK